MHSLSRVFLTYVVIFLAHAVPSPTRAQDMPTPDLNDQKLVSTGEKKFNQNCVYCHGNAGTGGKGAALQGRTDFTPEYLFHTISNGKKRGALVMPPWKDAMPASDIWALSAYILSLRRKSTQQ